MKNVKKSLVPVLILIFIIAFLSCKNNKTEKVESEEEMPMDTATTVAVMEPFKVIVIKHKVANYDKWRKEYDAHDSVRQVYGISHFVVGRGMDDPNTIIVIDKMNDVMKAKEFSALPSLKEAMKNAGVIGKPEFSFYDVIRNDDSKIDIKERLMVTHHVKDFDAWLKVYDAEGMTKRMEEGLIDRGVARSVDDPNMVTLVFAISDMAKAKVSINSEAKKKLMNEAGVEGAPQILYYKLESK
jgi:quinol monooxygenase YgiN